MRHTVCYDHHPNHVATHPWLTSRQEYPVYREKSIIVAYILWLTLGILGGHKFYLRRPIIGICYLCTGGLLLIGWLIDLFTLPRQVEEFNYRMQLDDEYDEYDEYRDSAIEDLEDEIDELRGRLDEHQRDREFEDLEARVQSSSLSAQPSPKKRSSPELE